MQKEYPILDNRSSGSFLTPDPAYLEQAATSNEMNHLCICT
jgi:hypothetical protein